MKFHLARIGSIAGLIPFDEAAERFIADQMDGEPIEVEVMHPRDMIEHRRIFDYIGELAQALHKDRELIRAELLYATGNFKLLGALSDTHPVIAVNSMARSAMTDRELHTFWTEAKEVIESKMLQRVTDTAERARLAELLLLQPA